MKRILSLVWVVLGLLVASACNDPAVRPTPDDTTDTGLLQLEGTDWGYYEEYNPGVLIRHTMELHFQTAARGEVMEVLDVVGYPEYSSNNRGAFDYVFDGLRGSMTPEGRETMTMEYQPSTRQLLLDVPQEEGGGHIRVPFTQHTANT